MKLGEVTDADSVINPQHFERSGSSGESRICQVAELSI